MERQGGPGKGPRVYEQAIKLDSSYARAWAQIARLRGMQADRGYLPSKEAYQKAHAAADQALALDPNLALRRESEPSLKFQRL